ncbi:MAG: CoA transferase [Rhizomicrobium sp.]
MSIWPTEYGRARLRDLVREGDVFSQGCRQGALERQSFGPIELAQLRPGIVCTAINCYGHEGPWRTRPGW